MVDMTQIDEFRRRTNSSYEEARFFIEKHQGDVLDAILDFENSHKAKRAPGASMKGRSGWLGFAEILQKGFDIRVILLENENTIFGVPLLLLLLLMPYWFIFFLIGLLFAVIGFKLRVIDEKNTHVDMVAIFEAIGRHMGDVHHERGKKSASSGRRAQASESVLTKEFTPAPESAPGPEFPPATAFEQTPESAPATNLAKMNMVQTPPPSAQPAKKIPDLTQTAKDNGYKEYTIE